MEEEGGKPVVRVLEALKEASEELRKKKAAAVAGDHLKALLELEAESGAGVLSSDPNLAALAGHLHRLKSLVDGLRHPASFLARRSASHQIAVVAAAIAGEIQSWIDRESAAALVGALSSPTTPAGRKSASLRRLEARVSEGFQTELQTILLNMDVFAAVEAALCDPGEAAAVREAAGSAVVALVRFNKDVFVGEVLMGPTVRSLVSLASGEAMRVLGVLIRAIKSPLVDEVEFGGYVPKIVGMLSSETARIMAAEVVMEMAYFGRKEAVDAMVEEGVVENLMALQRSEKGGSLVDDDGAAGEGRPFASCVARFAVQLEVGEGLRQREKRAFKQEVLRRVKAAAASEAEAAAVVAEVLWGASPW